jgi:site-specific DNA-cytosine methylase
MTLTFGSLFTGGGYLDKGLEDAGMACRWQCEIEDNRHVILRRHWPGIFRGCDINDLEYTKLEPVNLIAFGFPCKDISVCHFGSRLMLKGKHSGLFYKGAEIIKFHQPEWVLIENVIQVMGLMPAIREELDGYHLESSVISADRLGGYTRRKRAFIVGHLGGPAKHKILDTSDVMVQTFRSGGVEDILPMCLPWSGGVSLERLGSCVVVPNS